MATLYRCRTPTDVLCACGKVARRLRQSGIEFEEVEVPYMKRYRPEVEALTGQRWVPVLVHGDEVVHDSHRIVEYLDHVDEQAAERAGSKTPGAPSRRTRTRAESDRGRAAVRRERG